MTKWTRAGGEYTATIRGSVYVIRRGDAVAWYVQTGGETVANGSRLADVKAAAEEHARKAAGPRSAWKPGDPILS